MRARPPDSGVDEASRFGSTVGIDAGADRLASLTGVHDLQRTDGHVTFSVDDAELPAVLATVASLRPRSLVANPPSLEELFDRVMAGQRRVVRRVRRRRRGRVDPARPRPGRCRHHGLAGGGCVDRRRGRGRARRRGGCQPGRDDVAGGQHDRVRRARRLLRAAHGRRPRRRTTHVAVADRLGAGDAAVGCEPVVGPRPAARPDHRAAPGRPAGRGPTRPRCGACRRASRALRRARPVRVVARAPCRPSCSGPSSRR